MNHENFNISELIDKVSSALLSSGYKPITVESYRPTWNKLRIYMMERDSYIYSKAIGEEFLKNEFSIISSKIPTKIQKRRISVIKILDDYELIKRKNRVPDYFQNHHVYPKNFCNDCENFISHRREFGVAESTLFKESYHLKRFCDFLNNEETRSLKELNPELVRLFLCSFQGYAPSTIKRMLITIRLFLNWLYKNNMFQINYAYIIPAVKGYSKDKIPSAFTSKDINRILSSIDRGSPTGKRDYAMILLASYLGLRSSDICNLTFSNIRWDLNMIELIQEKTKKRVTLPLLGEIGNAIIDYTRFGRPQTSADTVFVRHIAPIKPLSSSTLYYALNKYMSIARITIPPGKRHGVHSLRHSLASSLLEGNIPIPIISKVLGHTDMESTSVYLKIDVIQLKKCALPVAHVDKWRGECNE